MQVNTTISGFGMAPLAPMAHCRLCNGVLAARFREKLLQKYDVNYYKCSSCGSLQTEPPYWLDEAYGEQPFNLDVGAVQRNLNNFAFVVAFCRMFNVRTALDFGARDGLLCRFMRDHEIDCLAYDKYAKPMYALDFSEYDGRQLDLVTAFEVFEHFPNPATDLEEIFRFKPSYLLCTTELYTDQGPDWWYLSREGGQHVFFYSPQAIAHIAQRYGYGVTQIGGMLLFFRPDIPNVEHTIIGAQHALDGWVFQAIKSYIFLAGTPGVERDFRTVLAKVGSTGPA